MSNHKWKSTDPFGREAQQRARIKSLDLNSFEFQEVIKDAMRFAMTTALGDACTVGGYVVDDCHVESVYKAWRKS